MNWGHYLVSEINDFFSLDKRSARAMFGEVMAGKDARIAELRALTGLNGVELGGDVASIDGLEAWLWSEARLEPGSFELTAQWKSVCFDVGLYIGDVLIARHPGLRWDFLDISNKYDDRFAPAVIGFGVKDKWYGPAFPLKVGRMVLSHLVGGAFPPGSLSRSLTTFEELAAENGK